MAAVRRAWVSVTLCGLAGALAGALALGCEVGETSYTRFPVPIDTSTGAVLVGAGVSADQADDPGVAVIDTLSPLTVVDGVTLGEALRSPRRRKRTLTLYSRGDVSAAVAQARFTAVDTLDLHPCRGQSDPDTEPCPIGFEGQTQPLLAVIGADLLAETVGAVRFAFAADQLTFFPDISGDNLVRGALCEAVYPQPFYGGGTLVVSGAEVAFSGRRVAIGACLGANVNPREVTFEDGPVTLPNPDAVSALFLIATGLPITLVSESFYERYQRWCQSEGCAAPDPGAAETLYLPSGPITLRRARVADLTLVSEGSDRRGPCQEVYANAYLIRGGNCPTGGTDDCPCIGDNVFCRTGASVTLPAEFEVGVLDDATPLLQGLRDELRPDLPELDGLLAPPAMTPLVFDVDYPNNRAIARCAGGRSDCLTLPAVLTGDTRDNARADCVRNLDTGPDAGVPDADLPDAGVPDAAGPDADLPDAQ
ncbi:hypothetical protein [Haliangium sp.]|uniref:hypothetical protein n=1 Tax=Haliangium sp. TaxID=2663208 RepID=UPI003D14D1AB